MIVKHNDPYLTHITKNYLLYENAKEACQEAWVQIFKGLNMYQEQGNFQAWIKQIVIRVCWKMIRKEKTLVHLDEIAEMIPNDEVRQIYDKFECEELLDLLTFVPTVSRAVFIMYVVDELSHKEIATAMDIKEVTSRAHLYKARKLLKEKYFSINKIAGNGL